MVIDLKKNERKMVIVSHCTFFLTFLFKKRLEVIIVIRLLWERKRKKWNNFGRIFFRKYFWRQF